MQEYWIGGTVIGFDGTVLEVFGITDVHRYHIYHIDSIRLSVSRRGTRTCTVLARGGRGTAMLTLETEEQAAAADALVAAVNQARAARGWPPVPTT